MDGAWKKQHSLVDFPVKNLDLSSFCMDLELSAKLGLDCKYDLQGMVLHFGSLTVGHYVSVVRNPFEQKWYQFDDQNRLPVPEDQLPKHNAYLLFYVRQDSLDKPLKELIPSVRSLFPGKPINTTQGPGYVIGGKVAGEGEETKLKSSFYVKVNGDILEMARSEILADSDGALYNDFLNPQEAVEEGEESSDSEEERKMR